MLAADTMEALGIKRGDYVIKVNSRKVLDGVMEAIGIGGQENSSKRLAVMRAVDKFDRLGPEGVRQLLGKGRKDESGDFTRGAELNPEQIEAVMRATSGGLVAGRFNADGSGGINNRDTVELLRSVANNEILSQGCDELSAIAQLVEASGYGATSTNPNVRVVIDPSVVRGLEYYTGPVFEAELTFEVKDEKGNPVRFGSVGGGGRYDDLVARFTGQKVPATGFSIGVSRLQAALNALHKDKPTVPDGPVIVTVMEKERVADYQRMVQELRSAGIRAELYLGNPKKFGKQLEYADRRASPCVVIQGGDERAQGKVTLKDLVEGAKAAAAIKDNKEWKEARPAQVLVNEADLVAEVRKILARHGA
jgi:histidyl-tRNA synthetase